MSSDEQAIRALVEEWLRATKAGEIQAVLDLMTDDMLFTVPGQEPFGKAAFAAGSAGMKDLGFEGHADVLEVQVAGDWAWARLHLRVTMTPPGSKTTTHAGYTLSIYKRGADGRWRLYRDANMVGPV